MDPETTDEEFPVEKMQENQKEFENPDTTDERRIELLTELRDALSKHYPDSVRKCINGGHVVFDVPYEKSLMEGHIYSREGVREMNISGACEFCFDKWFKEEDDEENPSEEDTGREGSGETR